MEPTPHSQSFPLSLGRFRLTLPLRAGRTGQEHVLQGVTIIEHPLNDTDEGPGGRLQGLEAWTRGSGEVLEERELGPALRGVRLREDPDAPWWSTWRALLDAGHLALALEAEVHEGQAPDPLDALVRVAGAYRPPGDGRPGAPPPDGFHLEHGIVALPPGKAERLTVRLALPDGAELSVTMTTPAEVESETALERWPKIKKQLGDAGVKVETTRARPRTAGGMDGEELVVNTWQGNQLRHSFSWSCRGEGHDGARPRTLVQMESQEDGAEDGLALWDRLLDSLEPAEPGGAP